MKFRRPKPVTRIDRSLRWLGNLLPKGLYARSLIIIIAPVVILQSVIAYAFYDNLSAGVANAEPLTRHAANEGLARRGSVERHVADDAVFFGFEGGCPVRVHNQLRSAKSFAKVIVGVAFKL